MATSVKSILDEVDLGQQVVEIDAREPLRLALRILLKHKIYSAPVYDQVHGVYYGFLDLLDVVTCIVEQLESLDEDTGGNKKSSSEEFLAMLQRVDEIDKIKANQVADLSKANPMVPLEVNNTLGDLLKAVSIFGAQKFPILDPISAKPRVGWVMTQSTLISWLNGHMSQLADFANKEVGAIPGVLKEVITVGSEVQAIEAFRLMKQHKIHGLPVVNERGEFLAHLSVKDLKVVEADSTLALLLRTTLQFVAQAHNDEANISAPTISIKSSTTIGQVVHRFAGLKRHRLYISEDGKNLRGVISLGDVLKALHNEIQ